MQKFPRFAPVARPGADQELHWHNARDARGTATPANDDFDYFLRQPQATAMQSMLQTVARTLARCATLAPPAAAQAPDHRTDGPASPVAAHAATRTVAAPFGH